MTKRFLLFGLLVAAFLVLAAPAVAYDGFRDDYSRTELCQSCHDVGGGAPEVYSGWAATAHAMVGAVEIDPVTGELLGGTANAEPIADGPGCAGCHSSNYAPAKHIPVTDPIPTDDIDPSYPYQNTAGDDAFSEPFVGCSSCHRNIGTAHSSPTGVMANADICGQCHSRYSQTVNDYPGYQGTVPAKRQYTLGDFNPLGVTPTWTPESITTYLNVASPESPQQMVYYKLGDEILPWSARGHEEGAAQYNEWANEGHADSLQAIVGFSAFMDIKECLECHSTDYKLMEEAGENPAVADAKYGVTCVGCHAPHTQSAQTSYWNEERNPQLTNTRQKLCVECHNAELAAQANGQPGIAVPGSEVHHPMKEMMNGTGAIDVAQGSPSVHKGRCVQCHMVPTSYDRNGVPMTGANHVFAIVEPEVAAEAVTTAAIGGEVRHMPASSCSSCHKQDGTQYALYLQDTLDDRQEAMHNWDDQVTVALGAAAGRLGFKGADDEARIANANEALNAIGSGKWSSSQLAFQKAFTNQYYIESEGSWGIHNWDYARTVILKALDQAKSVSSVSVVTLKANDTSVKVNATVKFTGKVNTSATGTVTIQMKKGSGSWANWKTGVKLNAGSYSASRKMTGKGTFYFRTKFAASDTQVGGTSAQVKVVVK